VLLQGMEEMMMQGAHHFGVQRQAPRLFVPVFQVLQVLCDSVLQCVAVCRILSDVYQFFKSSKYCVAVCGSVLQCAALS